MLLAIDIGNTRAKYAVLQNQDILSYEAIAKEELQEKITPLLHQFNIEACIYCSVAEPDPVFLEWLTANMPIYSVGAYMKLPFQTAYTSMDTLGVDRIALMAAATAFTKEACLVISAGTCITYNFIDEKGVFQGGAIAPGVQMRAKALKHFTAKLPEVTIPESALLIGSNTETSLQSGIINGVVCEIDGIIARYTSEYPKINVVLTGGDIYLLRPLLKSKIFADAHFLFKGLYSLYQLNRK